LLCTLSSAVAFFRPASDPFIFVFSLVFFFFLLFFFLFLSFFVSRAEARLEKEEKTRRLRLGAKLVRSRDAVLFARYLL